MGAKSFNTHFGEAHMVSLKTDRIFNRDEDLSLLYDEVYNESSPNKLTTSFGPSANYETRNYHMEYDF